MKLNQTAPQLIFRLVYLLAVATGAQFTQAATLTNANWSTVGSGVNSTVFALAASGSSLYAGGTFTNAGGAAATNIAKWNGSSWSALGSGMNGAVRSIAISAQGLYAGGEFTMAGSTQANYIAKWDGTNWSTLGSGMNGYVVALATSGSNLYAGGYFTTAGGISANRVAKWDGTTWSSLGSGVAGWGGASASALAVSGNDLYVGGDFTNAGGIQANCIAKWNGATWASMGNRLKLGYIVDAMAFVGTNLYVGGWFYTSITNSSGSNFWLFTIGRWDGNNLTNVGSGLSGGTVFALAGSGNNLYAGGSVDFTESGSVSRVSRWDGTNWTALTPAVNGDVYSAGIWGGDVYALAVSGNDLYAGGTFKTAGGKPITNLARAYLLPLPTLSVSRSSNLVAVSWPSPDTSEFTLEQSDKVAPTIWTSNSASINDDGTNKWVNLPATNNARFFRLRRP